MESKVIFSSYVILTTVIITLGLSGTSALYFIHQQYTGGFILIAMLLVIIGFALVYAPLSVRTDQNSVRVKSMLRIFKIRFEDIESITLFQPTMGALRICASVGYMGYWGLFREGDVGNYIAYYGKSSDCFLIILRNHDKYVLGCSNPQRMVETIKENINPNNVSD